MEYISGKTLRDLTPAGGLDAGAGTAIRRANRERPHCCPLRWHHSSRPKAIQYHGDHVGPGQGARLRSRQVGGLRECPATPATRAPWIRALTREGSIIGTVSYMSPEQAEGKRVDVRSDIFSFGSVMYEMLTGRRAFEGRSGISTLSSILRDDVKPIYQAAPDVPPLLEQIVLRCLPKEPSARWQSMKEIEGALLTLQRQLDPQGHFASPVPIAASSPVLPSAFQAAASAPGAMASVSTESEPSFERAQPPERAPMPSVTVPVNGPTKTDPTKTDPSKTGPATTPTKTDPAKTSGNRPPTKAPNGVRQPPIAPSRVGPRRSGTSPRMLVLILGLIGCALVAGAGIGAWYWWKSHQAAAVAIASVASGGRNVLRACSSDSDASGNSSRSDASL